MHTQHLAHASPPTTPGLGSPKHSRPQQHSQPRPTYYCTACGDDINPGRAHLGYRYCMACGEDRARLERMTWTVAPLNKSNYVLVTDREELKQLNPKRTTI